MIEEYMDYDYNICVNCQQCPEFEEFMQDLAELFVYMKKKDLYIGMFEDEEPEERAWMIKVLWKKGEPSAVVKYIIRTAIASELAGNQKYVEEMKNIYADEYPEIENLDDGGKILEALGARGIYPEDIYAEITGEVVSRDGISDEEIAMKIAMMIEVYDISEYGYFFDVDYLNAVKDNILDLLEDPFEGPNFYDEIRVNHADLDIFEKFFERKLKDCPIYWSKKE